MYSGLFYLNIQYRSVSTTTDLDWYFSIGNLQGYYKYPYNCDHTMISDCQLSIMWFDTASPENIRFSVAAKNVNEIDVGFSSRRENLVRRHSKKCIELTKSIRDVIMTSTFWLMISPLYSFSKVGSDVVRGKVCKMEENVDCRKVEDRHINV